MRASTFLIFSFALLVPACRNDEGPDIPPGTRAVLEGWAGRLAPLAGLPPGTAPGVPDSAGIAGLMRLCEETPGGYSYFYRCLSDSVAALELPPVTGQDSARDTLAAPGPIPVDSLRASPGGTPGTGPSTR